MPTHIWEGVAIKETRLLLLTLESLRLTVQPINLGSVEPASFEQSDARRKPM